MKSFIEYIEDWIMTENQQCFKQTQYKLEEVIIDPMMRDFLIANWKPSWGSPNFELEEPFTHIMGIKITFKPMTLLARAVWPKGNN